MLCEWMFWGSRQACYNNRRSLSCPQAELENQSQELSLMGSLVERYSLAVADMLSVVTRLKDSVQMGSQSVTPQLEHLDK